MALSPVVTVTSAAVNGCVRASPASLRVDAMSAPWAAMTARPEASGQLASDHVHESSLLPQTCTSDGCEDAAAAQCSAVPGPLAMQFGTTHLPSSRRWLPFTDE